jgi:hypothetical protein
VVIARDGTVFPAARNAMIDFHALGLFREPPSAHRQSISGGGCKRGLAGSFGRDGSARSAAILVAALCRTARQRPPVVGPKRRSATFAAPRSPARRQRRAAPGAAGRCRACQQAVRQQRGALGTLHEASAARRCGAPPAGRDFAVAGGDWPCIPRRANAKPTRANGRCGQPRLPLPPRGLRAARDTWPKVAACSRCRSPRERKRY